MHVMLLALSLLASNPPQPVTPTLTAGSGSAVAGPEDDLEEDGEDAEPAEGGAPVVRGFQQTYLPLMFDDELLPFTDDLKWEFVMFTIAIGAIGIPLSQLWLPTLMWDPKPKLEWDSVIKPWLLQALLPQLIGHAVLVGLCCAVPIWVVPFYGWVAWYILFVWSIILVHTPWALFNAYRGSIAAVQVWDNALRMQGLADQANARWEEGESKRKKQARDAARKARERQREKDDAEEE